MTPAQMAQIHQAAFKTERGWTAAEFTELLGSPFTTAFTSQGGVAITRTVAEETELLTLAIAPEHLRCGIAQGLMMDWLTNAQSTATTAFLEVASDNFAALGLYEKLGFAQSGVRRAYYRRAGRASADAMLMTKALTQG